MTIHVYTAGICSASVCAPKEMSVEAVTEELNATHPTGIESRWSLSTDPTFATGQPNPCPCEINPLRLHYLFAC